MQSPPGFQISTTRLLPEALGKTVNKWGQQISRDTSFNIMKEFWPSISRKLFGH